MKKKVFFPHSVHFILLISFFWSFTTLIIILFSLDIANVIRSNFEWNFVNSTLIVCGILFLIFTCIRLLLSYRISLTSKAISSLGDFLPKFEKVQYKCSIKLTGIQDINIIQSKNNSENRKIKFLWVSSAMPKKYMEFTLNNGSKKRICVNYYTKKQINKIIYSIKNNQLFTK